MRAKRHHYVPRVLLRRFSSAPLAENPPLWKLDKETGQPVKTSVNNETVINDYYRLEQSSLPPTFVEETLSAIEGEAAEPIRRLADGEGLTPLERLNMAMFLHVQRQRTPLGRKWSAYLYGKMAQVEMEMKLQDPKFVRETWGSLDEKMSEEEIERWRLETLADLQSGRLTVEASQDHEAGGIFFVATDLAPIIAGQMTWFSLRAPRGSAFICSDHPVHIYSKDAPSGWGVGWASPGAEATMPIDERICLMLKPGPPIWALRPVNASMVREINLRAYASAQWSLYGPSRQAVQDVVADAKRNRKRVAEFQPRSPRFVLFESVEGEKEPRRTTVYQPPKGRPERRPKSRSAGSR